MKPNLFILGIILAALVVLATSCATESFSLTNTRGSITYDPAGVVSVNLSSSK